jgi:3,4-dihydroxy 2-butanone 4-phosphate synthase/GTP cyclohydrolase II
VPVGHVERLNLAPLPANGDPAAAGYAVPVDARRAVGTGSSAGDRATTLRLLAGADTVDADLRRPGHIFPLPAASDGVLARPGPAEAAMDLAWLAGQSPVAALCELVNRDGSLMGARQVTAFARRHGLPRVTIAELTAYRRRRERPLQRVADVRMPTAHGSFRLYAYSDVTGDRNEVTALALVAGAVDDGRPVRVKVHRECATGDTLRSIGCHCGSRLSTVLSGFGTDGRGVLVYLRTRYPRPRATGVDPAGRPPGGAPIGCGASSAFDIAVAGLVLLDLGIGAVHLLADDRHERAPLIDLGLTVLTRTSLSPTSTAVPS